MTGWAFDHFDSDGLPRIMLLHDLDNPASCRVAAKAVAPHLNGERAGDTPAGIRPPLSWLRSDCAVGHQECDVGLC